MLSSFPVREERHAPSAGALARGVPALPDPGRVRRVVLSRRKARVAGLSPCHLNRVFRRALGLPPHAFQTQLRVVRAGALLRRGWPLAAVAAETGFADQSHLTRRFKTVVGVTPGAYRERKNVQDRAGAAG